MEKLNTIFNFFMLSDDISTYIKILLGAIGIFTTIYKCYKYINKELKLIKETHFKINLILSEVTPNHGTSIKDKINGIEGKLNENTELTIKIYDRQRWLLDNENNIIFESDNTGKCVWVNKAYCELLHRDFSYFIGNGWKNAIHPDDRERVWEQWNICIKDKIDSENTFRLVDKEGEVYNVYCLANKSIDNNGYMGYIKVINKIVN